MNQEILTNFGTAAHELFIRWDALKLAVEHMGGRNGQQVRENIRKKSHIFQKFQFLWLIILRKYLTDCERDRRLCFQLLYTK